MKRLFSSTFDLDKPDVTPSPKKRRRSVALPSRDFTWQRFDAIYEENATKIGASNLFGPPLGGAMQYMSTTDFEAAIPIMCANIKKTIKAEKCDRVVLWVSSPGKSNFWVTLKAWPFLRDIVDEVWSTSTEGRDPYGGGGYSNAHVFLDDAIFSGEQMTRVTVEGILLQPEYACGGTDDHLIVVGAVVAAAAGMRRIEKALEAGDIYFNPNPESDEDDDDKRCLRVEFAYVQEMRSDFLFYFGYKVPDSHSIPTLAALLANGTIPGAELDKLSKEYPITLLSPRAPYYGATYTHEGRPIRAGYLDCR